MEIASFVIEILSLLATIAVAFVIYFMERRSEARHQQERAESEARSFIISHPDDDMGFLPMAVIACATHKYHKHNRAFYNDFNKLVF